MSYFFSRNSEITSKRMDYKKIIKSRKLRLKLLSLLNWIPDRQMIFLQYWIKTGRILNLKNPKRYTEKLQWYKLNIKDPKMPLCADKYLVHGYVEKKGLSRILNPIYQVYNNVSEVNFSELPKKFVLKKSNGGGGNDVLICKDKDSFDISKAKDIMKDWTQITSNGGGREWVYYEKKPVIIAERFLETKDDDLVDYKFFCFNGVPEYLYVINGRKLGDKVKLGIFDLEFNQLPYYRCDEEKMHIAPERPSNFESMIEIVKKLSEDFLHARVDLYNIEGEIFFGELTFFDGSGYQTFEPDEFDFKLGENFVLKNNEITTS